jgi:hypothetical protein
MSEQVPGWVETALNGNSVRVAVSWEPTTPGDLLAGKVVARSKQALTVAVESGTLDGEPLEVGAWRRLRLNNVGVLAQWAARDAPDVGDRVAVKFLGRDGGDSGTRIDYACGTFREAAQPWDG